MMEWLKCNWRLYLTAAMVNIMSFLSGQAFAFTSPVLPKLNGRNDQFHNPLGYNISPLEESWIAGCLSLGACIGPIISGAIVDSIGRKKTILLLSVPIFCAYLILMFATVVELYYFARLLIGVGIGCVYCTVPMYIGEIAEDHNRGKLGCFMMISACFGTFIIMLLGPYFEIKMLCFFCIIPILVFFITFSKFGPESPYYLILKHKDEDAIKSLESLRCGFNPKEFEDIKKTVKDQHSNEVHFKALFKSKAIIKGLSIAFGLMFFQQFSGIVVVVSYMQSIFEATGTTLSAENCATIVALVQIFVNCVTAQLIDRLGRKILLLFSLAGICLSHTALGTYFYMRTNHYDLSNFELVPLISVGIFMIAFNLGIGGIPWVILGEFFPTNVKSLATTIVSSFCLFLAFILTVVYPNVSLIIGIAQSFWIFAGFSFLGIMFVGTLLPETKGKSLQEIQVILCN